MAMPGWSQPFFLDGTHWQAIPYEAKVTYIKGVGNMADFEVQVGASQQSRTYCIAAVLVQELKEKTIDTVVKEIDAYYKENPDKLYTSVLEVMVRRATTLCPPEKFK